MSEKYDSGCIRELEDIIESADLRHRAPPERYEPGKLLELEVTGVCPAKEGKVKLLVEDFAGGGFAGQVYRVRLVGLGSEDLESTGLKMGTRYAVKIHVPPSRRSRLFRDVLYWLGYQGAFAAQVNPDASRSGVLWQKLIRRGAKIRFGDERCVADTYATFFDPEIGSFGEINEWVEGRTWKFELDSELFSRGRDTAQSTRFSKEYLAKKEFMAKFVELLHAMGATELTRQYEWWTGKSQPNVYKRLIAHGGAGEVLTTLDFRPGLTLLFFLPMSPVDFKLILHGLRRRALVQFDRGNLDALQAFCSAHPEEFEDLQPALEELKRVDPRYRESQPDITHHGRRLLFDGGLSRKVKDGIVRAWRRLGLTDDAHAAVLDGSAFAFGLFYLAGAIPVLGRLLRRLWGNVAFRSHVKGCCGSLSYLCRALGAKQAECLIRWHRKGRVGEEGIAFFLKHPLIFSTLRVFPGLLPLPAKAHRCLIDWKYAMEQAKAAVLFPIRFYRSPEFRIAWLNREVEAGESKGMLRRREKERILSQIKDPFIQKYLKCLAVHFCTFPVTKGFMVLLAVYAYFNFGDSWHESLAYAMASMIVVSVLPISPGSFLRGSYVVYLMIRERNVRNYWLAALLSYWHYVGYLGFPLQMAKEFPALARLIASRWVTRVVKVVPVFGESGALLEHLVFDLCVNAPLSIRRRIQLERQPAKSV
jgi:hypothetical protein